MILKRLYLVTFSTDTKHVYCIKNVFSFGANLHLSLVRVRSICALFVSFFHHRLHAFEEIICKGFEYFKPNLCVLLVQAFDLEESV